ncbi:PmoA family protein [Botrimarina sp.]|uniref:DUF6807 domain-containing protein n=1 Tax=Botrimarina sp. TaxID=2795802 RepID=UPI0032EC5E78
MAILRLLAAVAAATAASRCAADVVTVLAGDSGVTVRADGAPFASYLFRSGTRPVLWPVVGPGEVGVTRDYPLQPPAPHGTDDHVHHRSMWIGYEGVNGVDFWHEPETDRQRPLPIGTVRRSELVRADSTGEVATVGTRNDWLDPEGKPVAHDQRLIEFRAHGDTRTMDFFVDIWSPEGPLRFGDTKEGMFAIRVADSMRVDAGRGGRIRTSAGLRDAAAWGQPAEWADYSGPVDGQACGVAIFAHPSGYNPKPRWHVRPYGLFAANPFGVAAYSEGADAPAGGAEFDEGERVRLRYRVLLYSGRRTPEWIAERFREYADEP